MVEPKGSMAGGEFEATGVGAMAIRIRKTGTYLNQTEVAERMGCSRMQVWRWIEGGDLEAVVDRPTRLVLVHEVEVGRFERSREKKSQKNL